MFSFHSHKATIFAAVLCLLSGAMLAAEDPSPNQVPEWNTESVAIAACKEGMRLQTHGIDLVKSVNATGVTLVHQHMEGNTLKYLTLRCTLASPEEQFADQ